MKILNVVHRTDELTVIDVKLTDGSKWWVSTPRGVVFDASAQRAVERRLMERDRYGRV